MRAPASWWSLILLCGLVAPPLWAQTSDDPQQVTLDFETAYRRSDYPRAIDLGLKLVDFFPRESKHQYNLACVYALNGDNDEALKWLSKSAACGFSNLVVFQTDRDLRPLRDSPEYAAALKIVKKNHAQALVEFEKGLKETEPLIVLPPGHDPGKPAPLILALHPFGGTSEWIVDRWRTVAAEFGAILVAPQAVRRQPPGYQWGDAEEADILVTRALRHVFEKHTIDRRRSVLTGFSQGGFLCFVLGPRHSDVFSGVIPVGGGYIRELDAPPEHIENPQRFFIMVGDKDRAAHGNQEAAKDLEAAGATVKLKVYEGVGHTFPPNRDEELREALRFVLEG